VRLSTQAAQAPVTPDFKSFGRSSELLPHLHNTASDDLAASQRLRAHFVSSHESFAFPVLKVLPKISRDQEPAGSLHLFRSEQNSYPHRYSTAFAFSGIPYPHPLRCALRFPTSLRRRNTGFPRSAHVTGQGRSRLSAGGIMGCVLRVISATTIPLTFLVQACQPLSPVNPYDVCQRFTCVLRAVRFSPPSACEACGVGLTSRFVLHFREALSSGLHTPSLPATHAGVENMWQHTW
jgi:hypothetical protein